MTKYLLCFLFVVEVFFCQNISYHKYSDEQGLASNLTKTLIQDDKGFIWIATDAGLARFDGKNFINISEGLPSLYVKDVLQAKDGKIIIATDLGVGYLVGQGKEYTYKSLISGSTSFVDSLLFYPKDLFVDRNNTLWIGDNNGICKFKNGKIKKYSFSSKYSTDNYLHSFIIVEDNYGNIFASSWQGYLFRLDQERDIFIEIPLGITLPQFYINQLKVLKDNSIFAATSYGLLKVVLDKGNNVLTSSIVLPLINCMTFYFDENNWCYIGTGNAGLFRWELGTDTPIPMQDYNFRTIVNYITGDKDKNLWVCSDEGIGLIQKTFFSEFVFGNLQLNGGTSYVRTLLTDEKGLVYFSDQENVYSVGNQNNNYSLLTKYNSNGKRVYTFAVQNEILWVSNRNGELVYKKGNYTKTFGEKEIGVRLTVMDIDDFGNLWGYAELSGKIIKIDKKFNIEKYDISKFTGLEPILKVINNQIYFVSNLNNFTILKFNISTNSFEEIKVKNKLKIKTGLVLNDILLLYDNSFLAASNIGLLKFKDGIISVLSGSKEGEILNTKALLLDKSGRLWVGTEHGVLLKVNNEFTTFSKNDGLPNTVVSPHGIVIDKDEKIWVATSSGLAYWQLDKINISKTPKPEIFSVLEKNMEVLNNKENLTFTGKTNLKFEYASLIYPNKIQYKYKLVGLMDNWSDLINLETQSFINLPEGEYVFQVKAQQTGYLWSDITEIKFIIYPAWYLSVWMIVIYFVIGVVLIILATVIFQKRKYDRIDKQNKELEIIINEKIADLKEEKEITERLLLKTKHANEELERVNTELIKANEFKSEILSIAAHDLKNPLGTIISLLQLIKEDNVIDSETASMLDIIHTSSNRMLSLITELLESIIVENTKFKLQIKEFSISELVQRIVLENQIRATKKKQVLKIVESGNVEICADEKWIYEIIDNIISNAVKYSPIEKEIIITLIDLGEIVQIKVKDEGPGFTKEDKEMLFVKFQKLSARPTGGESSTGLGLAIVKELIDLHQGNIWVESEEGKGACFVVELQKKLKII
ncbi:MAG: ATP-binding protein [bacterium]